MEILRIILLKFYSVLTVLTQPKMRGSCKYLMFLQIKTGAQYTLYWPTTGLTCTSRIYCYNFFMIPQKHKTIHKHRHFLILVFWKSIQWVLELIYKSENSDSIRDFELLSRIFSNFFIFCFFLLPKNLKTC